MDNLEKKVADTILQRASDVIEIDGREYPIAPPTPATIILVSELVSEMPAVDRKAGSILHEVLGTARDMRIIGRIAATLILGAKRIRENRMVMVAEEAPARRWSWKKFRFTLQQPERSEAIFEVDYLAERILYEVSPGTLLKIVSKRLGMMQIGDFFELTASLSEANLLKRTKEAVTASGD